MSLCRGRYRLILTTAFWIYVPSPHTYKSTIRGEPSSFRTRTVALLQFGVLTQLLFMSTNCSLCVKVVLDAEEGVFCDADCEWWFHRDCLRMGKTEYQRISADNNIKWECNRTDCKKFTADPIHDKLDAILKHLSSFATNVEISEGIKLIKQDLEKGYPQIRRTWALISYSRSRDLFYQG